MQLLVETVICPELPGVARSYPELPGVTRNPKVKTWTWRSNLADVCQKRDFPRIAMDSVDWPEFPGVPRSPEFPGVPRSSPEFPGVSVLWWFLGLRLAAWEPFLVGGSSGSSSPSCDPTSTLSANSGGDVVPLAQIEHVDEPVC